MQTELNLTTNPKDKSLEDLPTVSNTQDFKDIDIINVSDTKTHNIKKIKQQNPYCKCIHCTLHISSVKNKFTIQDNTLFKIGQNANKLLVSPCSSQIHSINYLNSNNQQWYASKNKLYYLKRDIFWKGMCKRNWNLQTTQSTKTMLVISM